VVTLALPELLEELDTTVEGVAAVIGVYTVVLALVLVPAEWLARRLGPGRVAAAGFALFAAASLACALADTLSVLLVARGIQAVGGGAGLVAVFSLLHAERAAPARRLWLAVAVLGAAVGPALGGALTQAFDWRAIFVAQVPVALAAALAALAARRLTARERAARRRAPRRPARARWPTGRRPPERFDWAAGLALALVSAALTAGALPARPAARDGLGRRPPARGAGRDGAAARRARRLAGPGRPAAARRGGCLLVGLGTAALAFLPTARPGLDRGAAGPRGPRDRHGPARARRRAAARARRARTPPACSPSAMRASPSRSSRSPSSSPTGSTPPTGTGARRSSRSSSTPGSGSTASST
jgi:MFS family permease